MSKRISAVLVASVILVFVILALVREPTTSREIPAIAADTQGVGSQGAAAGQAERSPRVPAPRGARLDQDGNVIADTFNVRHNLRGNRLIVTLDTDLPDETVLMTGVYRTYKQKGSQEDYVVDYFSERSTVGEWRRPQTIVLDNDEWRAELDRARRMLAAAGEPVNVTSISPNVVIRLTVPINQPSSLFKRGNSNLRGRVVEESGWGRVIHGGFELHFPLDAEGVLSVEWADPLGLEAGYTYRLSKETPLMPETSPSDPLEAITRVTYLRPGTEFTVAEAKSIGGWPWYRCAVRLEERVLDGWINSAALIGQELEVVR